MPGNVNSSARRFTSPESGVAQHRGSISISTNLEKSYKKFLRTIYIITWDLPPPHTHKRSKRNTLFRSLILGPVSDTVRTDSNRIE